MCNNSDAAAGVCVVGLLSMRCVAISRNHFVDEIAAPNTDAPSNVAGFDAVTALARAAPATDNGALGAVDGMKIAATTMMQPPAMSPRRTTFGWCESLPVPSEHEKRTEKKRKMSFFFRMLVAACGIMLSELR